MNWISIKDSLPLIEETVLITDGKMVVMGEIYNIDDKGKASWFPSGVFGRDYDFEYGFYESDTTHWMKLPSPPKSDTDNKYFSDIHTGMPDKNLFSKVYKNKIKE